MILHFITRVSASQPITAYIEHQTPAGSSVTDRKELEMFRKKAKTSKTIPNKSQLAGESYEEERF